MDMSFQKTGAADPGRATSRDDPDGCADLDLLPVLFSGYRDLSKLRHDFPLVLVEDDAEGAYVRSLSGIINGLLREIAPAGVAGERLRKHVLRLEEEVRTLVSGGSGRSLSDLWTAGENNMLSRVDDPGRENLVESLRLARGALRCDGVVIECDQETAYRLVLRARAVAEREKTRKFGDRISRLVLQLSDILKADFMKSDGARDPERLRRSVGAAFETEFDFEAMSRVLSSADPGTPLSESRRQRIQAVLSTLRTQRFFPLPDVRAADGKFQKPHSFVFTRCAHALKAFRAHLPEMADLVKAVSIAQLEIKNRYVESRHDAYFGSFGEDALSAEDLASFPSYFVHLAAGRLSAAEREHVFQILSSDVPIKILRQTDDILAEILDNPVPFFSGGADAMLATMAAGLTSAFVLQSGTAGLYGVRDRIVDGMAFHGPALINVYAGATANVSGLPAYILSAAAVESRAFPTFVYDPSAGPDWASRFCIDHNPQQHAAWPGHHIGYEDEELQTVSADIPFTVADFAACDERTAGLLTRVSRAEWTENMVPLGEYLVQDAKPENRNSPYILMIDRHDRLHRVVVDAKLISAARRYGERWRSLQELGGIDNSHATRLLASRRNEWEEQERKLQPVTVPDVREETPPESADTTPNIESSEGARPAEEPFIETARCTTCNECTQLNNRMFAYNENMQAYIADPDAGSFKELVEAAEHCQVCIIHPGKPRNPDEADLEELIERAMPFN